MWISLLDEARMKVVGSAMSLMELVALLAERRYSLGLTSRDLEEAAGLADGHLSKIECGTKRLGHVTLPTLLSALGCRLLLIADDAAIPDVVKAELYTSASPRAAQRPAEAQPDALPAPAATITAPTADASPAPPLALLEAA
jgi:transcriptional regulator with XRE-family HTH domain